MDSLVEGIYAIQQFKMLLVLVLLEFPEGFLCCGIVGVNRVYIRRIVHLGKPLRSLVNHLMHVFKICTENYVLPGFVRHVLSEYFVKAVCVFKGAAEGFKILLCLFPHLSTFGAFDSALVSFQILLI